MLEITIACQNSDRTRPLLDGRVRLRNCDARVLGIDPEEIFHRAFRHREFDVAELSLSTHALLVARGDSPYVGIPVFPSRAFRHSALYMRKGAALTGPKDLNGCRVGVPDFQQTAGVWVRGILADCHGVDCDSIVWVQGGQEQPGRKTRVAFELRGKRQVEVAPADSTLNRLLAEGKIDAICSPRAPKPVDGADDYHTRVFPDFRTEEEAYFRSTGIFPIMHIVGIRRELHESQPWLAVEVFNAFEEARRLCMEELRMVNFLRSSLPWLADDVRRVVEVMGPDFWTYGLDANRAQLDTFLRYALADGLLGTPLSATDLFAANVVEPFRV